jgi:anti-sigma regulatory factor (Ser/Thr protein kinase)
MAAKLNHVDQPAIMRLPIRDSLDCAVAQQRIREIGAGLGFLATHVEEICLAVSELTANLVKHAGHGVITFTPLHAGSRIGIEIDAQDHGPGITNIDQSLADGYSTTGGLGYGLGAVNRLMDEMDITSSPGLNTSIICRRWVRVRNEEPAPHYWSIGVATRSRRFAPENGDAYVIREWQGKLLVGVIDGLGHGELAQQAALTAQGYVRTHYDLPLDKIFSGAGRACLGTRGVVMALARFENSNRISLATVGNIEARVWSGRDKTLFNVQRGILGVSASPHVVIQENNWSPGWLLILHTDGVQTRWQWQDFPGLEREPAETIARKLLHALATKDDDATVLVVRNLRP